LTRQMLKTPFVLAASVSSSFSAEVNTTRLLRKSAVTDFAASIDSGQSPVPEQPPDQPRKSEFESGIACRVMFVPAARAALHAAEQLNASGAEVMRPAPSPEGAMLSR